MEIKVLDSKVYHGSDLEQGPCYTFYIHKLGVDGGVPLINNPWADELIERKTVDAIYAIGAAILSETDQFNEIEGINRSKGRADAVVNYINETFGTRGEVWLEGFKQYKESEEKEKPNKEQHIYLLEQAEFDTLAQRCWGKDPFAKQE